MNDYLQISSPELIFVADTHFRSRSLPGEVDRRERFRHLLAGAPEGAAVFLLGDIFDFYFEWRSVVSKRYFDIFHALYDCHRRGVQVHFVGGNHDYWVNEFLGDELGIRTHDGDVRVECQERKIVCSHGDLALPGDHGYKILRAIIRNRFVVSAAKIMHPDLLDAIARAASNRGRRMTKEGLRDQADLLSRIANNRFYRSGNDIFIMGHVHCPLHTTSDGKDFMILGDWIDNFTYGRLRQGKLTLETFKSRETGRAGGCPPGRL